MSEKLTGSNSTYPLDQPVILTGHDIAFLRAALEQIFNDSETAIFVPKYKFFDRDLGEYIEEKEVEDSKLKSGKVLKILDPTETFKSSNIISGYSADTITPLIKEAYLTIMHRMEMDAKAGKTISIEEFKKRTNVDQKTNSAGESIANGSN